MMHKYPRIIAIVFFGLLLTTCGLIQFSFTHSKTSVDLLLEQKRAIPWRIWSSSDSELGGSSQITVKDADHFIDFDFKLVNDVEYPYVSVTQEFVAADNPFEPQIVNLSKYSRISFLAKCNPENILSFSLYTYERELTKLKDFSTYRIADTFFTCANNWTAVDIDLTRLEVPRWWLDSNDIPLSSKNYSLNKVLGFGFGFSQKTPMNIESNVKIRELKLEGSKKLVVYTGIAFALFLWLGFVVWSVKLYARFLVIRITEKLQKDRPLITYQKLSITPRKDKDKVAILMLMASEYADHELNLEMASKKLGINRNKINEILRNELGFTFSAYLNRLRLAEAARLLEEQSEVNVSEIAGLVGYNNITYFNKLFKTEYGCAPNVFRGMYRKRSLQC